MTVFELWRTAPPEKPPVHRSELTGHEVRWSGEPARAGQQARAVVSWLGNRSFPISEWRAALGISDIACRVRHGALSDTEARELEAHRAALELEISQEELLNAAAACGPVETMRSSATGHEARWSDEARGWVVSWLPDTALTRAQAAAALEITEYVCSGPQRPGSDFVKLFDELRAEAGLDFSVDELITLAGGRGPAPLDHKVTPMLPAVTPPPRAQPGPWRSVPALAGVRAPARAVAIGVPPVYPGLTSATSDDAIEGLTGRAAPEVIRTVILRATGELAAIAAMTDALRVEFEAHNWSGLETLRSTSAVILLCVDVLVEVANKIGIGGAIVRAAYAVAIGVGDKASLFGDGDDGCVGRASAEAGSASARLDVVDAGIQPAEPLGEAVGGVAAPPSTPKECAPGDPGGGGTPAWRLGEGPVRRCTAPPKGWQQTNLCTSCQSDDDVETCSRKHEGEDLDDEWHVWFVNVAGFFDRRTNREFSLVADRPYGMVSVEDVLYDFHDSHGHVVARELATGELWTLDELRANYPEIVADIEAPAGRH